MDDLKGSQWPAQGTSVPVGIFANFETRVSCRAKRYLCVYKIIFDFCKASRPPLTHTLLHAFSEKSRNRDRDRARIYSREYINTRFQPSSLFMRESVGFFYLCNT